LTHFNSSIRPSVNFVVAVVVANAISTIMV